MCNGSDVKCTIAGYKIKGDAWKKLQSLLAQLRKAANHPYVMCSVHLVICCVVLSCFVLSYMIDSCLHSNASQCLISWAASKAHVNHDLLHIILLPIPSSLYPLPHHLTLSSSFTSSFSFFSFSFSSFSFSSSFSSFSSTPQRYLFPGAESDPQDEPTEEIVTASGKMVVLDRLLSKLKKKGHRVVLFSQYTSTLDIIHDYLGK